MWNENETLVMSTTCDMNAGQGYCFYCSNPPYQFIYHGGPCPLVKAKEYCPNETLKRIEFHEPQPATINVEWGIPVLEDSTKWAREVEITEPILLEPGRYRIILGELFKVEDDYPPGLEPLPEDTDILKAGAP